MFFKPRRQAVQRLYEAVLAQARTPQFFGSGRAPDTIDGRFEVLALHLALVIRRLRADGKKGTALAQDLFDVFVRDMDANLRELGASDSRFGNKMRHIIESFYGRAKAYSDALQAEDEGALRDALIRNLFDGVAQPDELDRMVAYCRAAVASLAAGDPEAWLAGADPFPRAAGS
jgi:cytochrome b pre-mRNA-processing protein 3